MSTKRLAIAVALSTLAAAAAQAQTPAEIEAALKAAHSKYQGLKEGKNADYIPALAKVDSNIYGIASSATVRSTLGTSVKVSSRRSPVHAGEGLQERPDAIAKPSVDA
jgi:hypothetical protein